jgi:2-oxoglutarate ferredoxin oxidoreductase subunit beta
MNRSFAFNSLHGRMPSLATGALFADVTLKGLGVSGDGDTASIGMGQFKHLMRRNLNMVYIVENNGVYGLTKGQFSATAEAGLNLKKQGTNPYMPIDLCLEAIAGNATLWPVPSRATRSRSRSCSRQPSHTTVSPCWTSSVLA